jgi:hypothetical protein
MEAKDIQFARSSSPIPGIFWTLHPSSLDGNISICKIPLRRPLLQLPNSLR